LILARTFSTGIARLEAPFLLNRRWVMRSAWTNLGYVSSQVVRRFPHGATESLIIRVEYMV